MTAHSRVIAASLAALSFVIATAGCGSDFDDPVDTTDIRAYELRSAVQRAREVPRTMEEVLALLPPGERAGLARDGYGRPFHYAVQGRGFELRSAGRDGVLHSSDDYVLADRFPAARPGDSPGTAPP